MNDITLEEILEGVPVPARAAIMQALHATDCPQQPEDAVATLTKLGAKMAKVGMPPTALLVDSVPAIVSLVYWITGTPTPAEVEHMRRAGKAAGEAAMQAARTAGALNRRAAPSKLQKKRSKRAR